jgi:tetratricopeptide (TPR) repeat protein
MMANADGQVEALRKRGLELAGNNRLDEARAFFVRIVEQCPEDAEAWCVLSNLNGRLGRIDEAENCCRRALALRPDYGEAHMNMGNVLSAKGRYDESLVHYQKVLQLDSRHSLAYCNLGNAQSALGRFDDAAASFRAAIDLDPRLIVAHFNLGNLYERQKRFDEAKSAYHNALKLNPHFAEAWHNLGFVLEQQGNAADAEGAFREALRLNPASAKAHHSLGHLLHELGRWAEAETAYREALRLRPDYEEVWNDLGNLLTTLERLDEAAHCYEEVLARRPDAVSHCNLGNVRLRQHRLNEAIDHYRQALTLDPERAEFNNNLGNALRQQGELAGAEAALREALRLDPNYAEAYANLGLVLTAKGRTTGLEKGGALALEEGLTSFRRALVLKPDYELAVTGEATILERQGEFEQAYARLAPFLEAGELSVVLTFASLCRPLRRCHEAIALLQRLLDRDGPHLEVSDRIALHFSLGPLLDAAGEYDRAFDQYHQGNDLARAIRPFDLQAHVQRNKAIMATYSKDFMAQAPRAAQISERPVFIVGMPRSGTTLVEQILASHPAVFGAGELNEMHSIVADLETRASYPYPQCIESLTPDYCSEIAQRYLAFIDGLAPPQAQRVTDKMPSNYLHLGLITLLFPQARIIHCVRDPLDTCLSCYFQDFDERLPFTYDLTLLGAYYAEYQRLMAHWRSVLDSPWLEVRYEDLVADQEGVSRVLVEHCGLEWDERCLRFYETQRLVSTASYDQVRQPLYSRSVGRWRYYERHLGPLRQALATAAGPSRQRTDE